MIPLTRATKIAAKVAAELSPFCSRIELAGSIRRQRPEVGDIDLVLVPTDRPAIEQRVTRLCKLGRCGDQYLEAVMPDGTQLDLWFAHPGAPPELDIFGVPLGPQRPANFGSMLLCRTGSTMHNVHLIEHAKRRGLVWNAHWGVYRDGRCIASETEEAVFEALGLPFVPPEQRER